MKLTTKRIVIGYYEGAAQTTVNGQAATMTFTIISNEDAAEYDRWSATMNHGKEILSQNDEAFSTKKDCLAWVARCAAKGWTFVREYGISSWCVNS